ncbi:MAG: hypothetical protein WAW86_06455 [Gammaproteobacteria bacterium]
MSTVTTGTEVCRTTSKHGKRCFSWSAVIVGALVAIGISFLLNMFSVAIGLTAFAHTDSATTLAVGGFIGMVIVAIVSMGFGGWVAGHMGASKAYCHDGVYSCNYGALYGFTAWCLALVFAVFMSAHMGSFVATSTAMLSGPVAVQGVANSVDKKAPTVVTVQKSEESTKVTANVNVEDAAKAAAMTTFMAFFLFFIGALSAAIFGHFAYACCCKRCEKDVPPYKV